MNGSKNKDALKSAFNRDTWWDLAQPCWLLFGPEAVPQPGEELPSALTLGLGAAVVGDCSSVGKEARLWSVLFSYRHGPCFRSVGSLYSEPMLVLGMCNQHCHVSPRALADTRQTGKLSKDQFALAMYFIQQKVSKGIDPPQVLSPDMVPPSERGTPIPVSSCRSVHSQSLP